MDKRKGPRRERALREAESREQQAVLRRREAETLATATDQYIAEGKASWAP